MNESQSGYRLKNKFSLVKDFRKKRKKTENNLTMG